MITYFVQKEEQFVLLTCSFYSTGHQENRNALFSRNSKEADRRQDIRMRKLKSGCSQWASFILVCIHFPKASANCRQLDKSFSFCKHSIAFQEFIYCNKSKQMPLEILRTRSHRPSPSSATTVKWEKKGGQLKGEKGRELMSFPKILYHTCSVYKSHCWSQHTCSLLLACYGHLIHKFYKGF